MKNGFFSFFFLFILLSMGLFSCENRVIGHERKVMEQEEKQGMKPKKPSRFYSRPSNLC
jgi:hypothetical protein